MAPERFAAGPTGPSIDIYALTCVLYEFLTGRTPFSGDTHERLTAAHLYEPPPTPSLAVGDVPQAMNAVIATGMAKNPAQRYQTANDLARAARAALSAPVQDAPSTQYAVSPPSFGVQDAVPPYHAPPPPPAYWTTPQDQGSSRTALWVTLGVVVALALVGTVAVLLATVVFRGDSGSSASPTADRGDPTATPTRRSSTPESTAPRTDTSPTPPVGNGSGATQVTVDGQDVDVAGSVTCATIGGNINIAMGSGTTGIGIVLADGDPPTVSSIGLGNVNGVTLAVGSGTGSATVEKSGNTYTITGTATGIDMANPMQPVTKPFRIQATCP